MLRISTSSGKFYRGFKRLISKAQLGYLQTSAIYFPQLAFCQLVGRMSVDGGDIYIHLLQILG